MKKLWKKFSVSKKIFMGVLAVIVFAFMLFMLGQMFLFKNYYIYFKTQNLMKSLENFCVDYSSWNTEEEINDGIAKYYADNDYYIMIMGENGNLLHMVSYEMVIKTADGNEVRIALDNIIRSEEIREMELKKGDFVTVDCREPVNSQNSRIYAPNRIKLGNKEWRAAPMPPIPGGEARDYENKSFSGEIVSVTLPSHQNMIIQRREAFTAAMDFRFRRSINGEEENGHYNYVNPETGNSYVIGTVRVEKNSRIEIVLAISPMQSVNEAVLVSRETANLWIIIGVLVAGFVAFIFTRIVTRPILNMMSVTEKMKRLDFSEKCRVTGEDEVGMLAVNINEMSEKLDTTIAELRDANEKLTRDIEHERMLEKQRKDFVDAVSHELKTPLAVIRAYTEGILDGISGENRMKYLNVILEETKRMDNLVLAMLENSRLEAGGLIPQLKEHNLNVLTEKVVQRFEKTANDAQIEYITDITTTQLKRYFDVTLIEQVISNFITNAIAHTAPGGVVRVSLTGEGDLSVENSGKHIDEEELELIWDKFYKTDKSRTRSGSGTGLGLSISKNILNLHKAEFGVENTNMGVKFRFRL